jgi:hypothetical protein
VWPRLMLAEQLVRDKEGPPDGGDLPVKMHLQYWKPGGPDRTLQELHMSLLGSPTTFSAIACRAATYDVLPCGLSALTSRYYMVKRGVTWCQLYRTVLANEPITGENIGATQWRLPPPNTGITEEADYGGGFNEQ